MNGSSPLAPPRSSPSDVKSAKAVRVEGAQMQAKNEEGVERDVLETRRFLFGSKVHWTAAEFKKMNEV